MATTRVVTLDELNRMDYEDFIQHLGNLVEHCGICAAAVWALRPFYSVQQLHSEICNFIDQLPSIGREGILRSHPDLAGKIAKLGLLTQESTKEQLAAGLNTLTDEEKRKLNYLNDKYKDKFGFPFVVCARENKKDAILNGMATRVNNSQPIELRTGVEEVKKIAYYRLIDLVKDPYDSEASKL